MFVQVIKLSDAVQTLPRQVTSCVHGVAGAFVEVGVASAVIQGRRFQRGAYCLGKLVWGKGWEELLHHLAHHTRCMQGKGPPCPPSRSSLLRTTALLHLLHSQVSGISTRSIGL